MGNINQRTKYGKLDGKLKENAIKREKGRKKEIEILFLYPLIIYPSRTSNNRLAINQMRKCIVAVAFFRMWCTYSTRLLSVCRPFSQ